MSCMRMAGRQLWASRFLAFDSLNVALEALLLTVLGVESPGKHSPYKTGQVEIDGQGLRYQRPFILTESAISCKFCLRYQNHCKALACLRKAGRSWVFMSGVGSLPTIFGEVANPGADLLP